MSKHRMRWRDWVRGGAGALILAASVITAKGGDTTDALLDALIRKGILSQKEAADIRAETTSNITTMAATKWKINDAIKDVALYGDVRFRYEYRSTDIPKNNGFVKGTDYRLERFRYALRFGLRGDLYDDFNYGIRLETSTNPRSPWDTFGKNTTAGSMTPADKAQSGIGIGQAFLGWKPQEWYQMTVGRMPMPLYTTPMVWDSDINPEGAFEKITIPAGKHLTFFLDGAQFIYQNNSPDTAVPSSGLFLLAEQAGVDVKLGHDMSFKIAPVIYSYAGAAATNNGLGLPYTGQGQGGFNTGIPGGVPVPPLNAINGQPLPFTEAYNEQGINDLLVLEIPAEYNFKIVNPDLGTCHVRIFGDYAYNIQGVQRARLAAKYAGLGKRAYTDESKAYQVGVGIGPAGHLYGPTQGIVYGSSSKKNDWEARFYWQHVEQYALDVNLMDSDFFEGRGNLEGIFTAFAYCLSDGVIATIRYGYANPINDKLGTGGNNLDIPIVNPIKHYTLVQADLTWRF